MLPTVRHQAGRLLLLFAVLSSHCPSVRGSRKSHSSVASFAPNFESDYPQFTPFNAPDFVPLDSVAGAPKLKIIGGSVHQQKQPEPPILDSSTPDSGEDIKPFKAFMMDLYKNYRQSVLLNGGNQTIGGMLGVSAEQLDEVIDVGGDSADAVGEPSTTTTSTTTERPLKLRRKYRPKHNRKQPPMYSAKMPVLPMPAPNSIFDEDEVRYNVGPGVNISVDPRKELVSVFLDEDCLKDVFTGRGRKHDLISKILPLFILPFLIQSAIVPFAVTTLKLLLVKSILVGKIAIFLLIISALKNHHNKYAAYDSPPQYVVDPPSRRSEAAVGYRVEGKPTTWVN